MRQEPTKPADQPVARHFGMDWLRIGAFALLIAYHVCMVFVPWAWHIKTQDPIEWLAYPMLAVNPWRLSLLFVVSGFASRAMLSKPDATLGRFLSQRTLRLLIPLIFGVLIVVPPQSWAELTSNGAIESDFLSFWLGEYFTFGLVEGVILPTYNHLWFILYLYLYTIVLGAIVALAPSDWRAEAQTLFDRLLARAWTWILAPIGLLVALWLLLFPEGGLGPPIVINDWYRHAVYFAMFSIGFGMARSETIWEGIRASWPIALFLSGIAYGFVRLTHSASLEVAPIVEAIATSSHAWCAIAGLIGLADRYWNRDAPLRNYLAVGVFPFYIIHQTIIVLVGFALIQAGTGVGTQLTVISLATILGCWLFYEMARRSGQFKPLFGLR